MFAINTKDKILARLHQLPTAVVQIEHAIHYWRTPEREPFQSVTGRVHIAALLESAPGGDALINNLPKKLCYRLNISWERVEACMPEPGKLDAVSNLMLAA